MELLAWGANTYGQLGLGFKSEQILIPTLVSNHHIQANNIQQIAAGAGHTLILTKNNLVFSCGWNSNGQLGSHVENGTLIFTEILQNCNIVQISCGWDFSAAVSNKNELFVWGSNAFLQLGIEHKKKQNFTPILLKNIDAKQVSCGLRHMAVLKTNGRVSICGSGNKGQLGLIENGEKIRETVLKTIPDLSDIISVSCGQFHTLALQSNGSLFGWGNNKHGQLGLDPETYPEILTPFNINLNIIPSGIYTGWTHSVILTKDGDIFNFGRNTYSQLGRECRQQFWQPSKLEINCDKIKYFCAGAEHNLAITNDDKILCWGWNEHGNCGTGDTNDVIKPTQIFLNGNGNAIFVACGTGQSFAIINKS